MLRSYPDADHVEWLLNKPCYSDVHVRLNKLFQEFEPNTQIVPLPSVHIDLERLLTHGKLFTGKVIFKEMESNQCHDNCYELYKSKKIEKVCCGYALSDDGLWRFHSWGKKKNGTIVETTCPRLLYFGLESI